MLLLSVCGDVFHVNLQFAVRTHLTKLDNQQQSIFMYWLTDCGMYISSYDNAWRKIALPHTPTV